MAKEPAGSVLVEGALVGNRYRVGELIGQGGQSYVHRGVDIRHGDEVALKVLKAKVLKSDPDAVERMFREAYAMATLQDTAAVRVFDQTFTDDGALCLVMELVRGQELGDWLDQKESRGERVEVANLVELLEPIVRTLSAAHERGIVHRDLKPSNIFVQHDGTVKLIDFGFAKFTRLRGFTRAHVIAGSPSYIAPEAWLNRRKSFDHRLDVYSLSAVTFRCLAGRPPFEAPDVLGLLEAVTRAPRPSLVELRPDLPQDVDAWVAAALAIDPAERFQSVAAAWTAFRNAVRLPRVSPG